MLISGKRYPVLAVALGLCILSFGCTIKKISEMDHSATNEYSTWTKSGTNFDAVSYVNSVWLSKVIPAFKSDSHELSVVLPELKKDVKVAIEKYGVTSEAGGMGVSFKVKGEAHVVSYDSSSRNGTLLVTIQPYDVKEGIAIKLQVGPVFRGTSIRDSLRFIKFSDIGNQLQFASLADQFNAEIKKEVIAPLDLKTIAGKTIYFYGAFTIDPEETIESITITPVILSLVD
jgi:predicted lipoprotein